MQTALIIEDNNDLRAAFKDALSDDHVHIIDASGIQDAFQKIETNHIDLILIDIGLPDGNGLQFCEELRNTRKIPNASFMFITGRKEIEDKVRAFSMGADDYIVKPVDMMELQARVNARLSKLRSLQAVENIIYKDELRIDFSKQKAFAIYQDHEEREIPLTFSEFKLLNYFIRNQGKVLDRKHLLAAVWGKNANIVVRTVDKHVSSLRKKLSARGSYIETVARSGYRFMEPESSSNSMVRAAGRA